jgi:hypothetical protein
LGFLLLFSGSIAGYSGDNKKLRERLSRSRSIREGTAMRRIITGVIAITCLWPVASPAEVVRFDIVERVPAFAGRSFGAVGAYERITARATIALNPSDDRNAVITDLAQAPRNPEGKVEATADVVILRTADPTHGNGTLLLEVPNRGRKLAPQLFDDSSQPGANNAQGADDAGIGFLHRQGFTMVWVGWQGDIPSRPGQLAMTAPVLKGVTGPAREEVVFDNTTNPARATLTWPAADPANLNVTVRAAWADARETPSGLSAKLVDPTTVEITRPNGFDAGALYEITYTARDPVPLGMGCPPCATSSASSATTRVLPTRCSTDCTRPSAAPSASASRNPAASCATSSISASTRTFRAASCSTA